ncbi:hypothetical protein GCM10022254_48380 [Actinomadura meridiana]|uniref:Uncharacterized protein n=1 Tax=Actinomadura meridiana TaxID=559626 RepID=A0ABP8CBS4_9ACTN
MKINGVNLIAAARPTRPPAARVPLRHSKSAMTRAHTRMLIWPNRRLLAKGALAAMAVKASPLVVIASTGIVPRGCRAAMLLPTINAIDTAPAMHMHVHSTADQV